MVICAVLGTVVSTIKNDLYVGRKLLMVRPVDVAGLHGGKSFLAVDLVQAGAGDTVLVQEDGSSARLMFENDLAPVRSIIIGIVDCVDIPGDKK